MVVNSLNLRSASSRRLFWLLDHGEPDHQPPLSFASLAQCQDVAAFNLLVLAYISVC